MPAILNKSVLALVLATFLTLLAQGGHALQASFLPQVDASKNEQTNTKPTTAEDVIDEDEEEAAEDESAHELNFSDSIPVDTVIDSWEKKYQQIAEDFGLDSSLNARFLATAVIVFILIIGMFISKKLTHVIRRKLYSLAKKFRVSERKIDFYHNAVFWLFIVCFIFAALSALALTWDLELNRFVSDAFITSAIANALTIYLIVFSAAILIDVICGLVESSFIHWGHASQARIDTLLPIARNTVYITIVTIFTLMLLGEIGINVMPLLAGAGVLGFAIGFGAQTLVKDLISGFIIILEDLIQVGDVVTLAGCTGAIEKITIRKVQLRSLDGTVFTVPFGEITIVGNLTKEFSYALLEVGIAYRENVDSVSEHLLAIDKSMREDEQFSGDILAPLEILGLDKFADSAVIIKARIKTLPLSRWKIGREFNRRMKTLFDQENIEIPFPHQTIYFGEDKDGKAPPLQLKELAGNTEDKRKKRKAAENSNSDSASNTQNTLPENDDDGDS